MSRIALCIGLGRLRDQIYAKPTDILNLSNLLDRLRAISEAGHWPPSSFERQLDKPEFTSELEQAVIQDEQGPLALEVLWRGRTTRYSLSSLYSDYFAAELIISKAVNPLEEVLQRRRDAYEKIVTDLELAAKTMPLGSARSYAEIVQEVLDICDSTQLDTFSGISADRAVRTVLAAKNRLGEARMVLRLVVICAWCRAWYDYRILKTEAFQGRFERQVGQQLRAQVKKILGLVNEDGFVLEAATVNYKRFFIKDGKDSVNELRKAGEQDASRRPFRAGVSTVAAFCLDEDSPANLTALDFSVCYAFATLPETDGGIGWLGGRGAEAHPRWLSGAT